MKISNQESDYNQKLRLNSTGDDVSSDIMNTARSERLLEARNTANSETMAEMFDSSKKSGKHQNSVKCVSSVCVPAAAAAAAASPAPCRAHRLLSVHRPPAPSSGQRQVKPPSRGRHR